MNGSSLSYEQIKSVSDNLSAYSDQMRTLLEEVTNLSANVGKDDVWGGQAAETSKEKFNKFQAKFEEFYKAVKDESNFLNQVVENYQQAEAQISGN